MSCRTEGGGETGEAADSGRLALLRASAHLERASDRELAPRLAVPFLAALVLGARFAATLSLLSLPTCPAILRPSARTLGALLLVSMAAFSSGLRAACSALRRASSRSTSAPPFLLAGFLRQLPCSSGRLRGTGS